MRAGISLPGKIFAGRFGRLTRGRIITLVIVWLVAVGVGFQGYQVHAGPVEAVVQVMAVPVSRGTIASTITAPGTVVATKQAKLTFGASGKVVQVDVQVGDSVTAGQTLGKVDTTQLEISLANAQSNLTTAQIKLKKLKDGGTPEAIAAAQTAHDSAVARYTELTKGATEAELKAAEQAVTSAQITLDKAQTDLANVQANPDPDGIQAAQNQLDQAKNSLHATHINRDATCSRSKGYECDAANANVNAQITSVANAELNLQAKQAMQGTALANAQKAVENAKASLEAAQAKLEQLKAGPTEAELLAAQNAVASAKSQLTVAKGGDPTEIALAEESVKQAEAAVKQAQMNLDGATITAPFDGVISAIGASEGEQIGSGTVMFTLVDPKAIRIEVNVPEIDVAKVAVGKPAMVSFDALPDQTLVGKVVAVAPVATVTQGVANYLVSISVDPGELSIPAGMSASGSIIVEQKDDVLMVPNRAVRQQGRERVVDVVVGDRTESRTVQVGISNDTHTEIIGGLNDGDQVAIRLTTGTTGSTRITGMGPMGGGGVVVRGPAAAAPAAP